MKDAGYGLMLKYECFLAQGDKMKDRRRQRLYGTVQEKKKKYDQRRCLGCQYSGFLRYYTKETHFG